MSARAPRRKQGNSRAFIAPACRCRGLDDRPPFFDLAFLESGQSFRVCCARGATSSPNSVKRFLDGWIGQRLCCRGIEFGDDILCVPSAPEAETSRTYKAGDAGLVRVGYPASSERMAERLASALILPARICGNATAPCTTSKSTVRK